MTFVEWVKMVYRLAVKVERINRLRDIPSESSHCGSVLTNQINIHEDTILIPGPAQWVKDLALP